MSWYEEIHCTTVDKFIAAIDSTRAAFGGNMMIYRGHGDAADDLLPTLYRKRYGNLAVEIELVNQFMLLSQQTGLLIPPDAMSFISLHNPRSNEKATKLGLKSFGTNVFEYDVGNVAFAMARHAGIPTRHLDFTWDPFVATYFAVDSALAASKDKCGKYPENIAVWALGYTEVHQYFGVIHHDWSHIPSLRNQQGLFIFDPTIDYKSLKCWTEAPSFNDRLSHIPFKKNTKKITLTCTDENLGYIAPFLTRRNITRWTMFPTYENVHKVIMSFYEDPEIVWEGKIPAGIGLKQ